MSGFSSMKKNSQSMVDKLSKEMGKLNSRKSYEDDRFWSLERDKAGNGYAVIRFLMAVEGEELPWVRVFSHGFQGKGGWLIENCPTTINGRKCPICEANNELWGSGLEANKTIARDRKRKLTYISNIYVVSDPSNRENEGKVFLFKYGKKIFDKLQEAMNPTTPDDTKFNPFDFWTGANFKLKAHMDSGYVSYEKSGFQNQEPLLEDDKKMEAIWKSQHALQPFVAPDQFKSYEELASRMEQVLRGGASPGSAVRAEEAEPEDFRSAMKKKTEEMAPAKKPAPKPAASEDSDDEEDAFSYFKKLADDE
jgi:hypothetical protein